MAETLDEKGQVLVLGHDSRSMTCIERTEGFAAEIKENHSEMSTTNIYYMDKLDELKEKIARERAGLPEAEEDEPSEASEGNHSDDGSDSADTSDRKLCRKFLTKRFTIIFSTIIQISRGFLQPMDRRQCRWSVCVKSKSGIW